MTITMMMMMMIRYQNTHIVFAYSIRVRGIIIVPVCRLCRAMHGKKPNVNYANYTVCDYMKITIKSHE